jgi:hypothetical protein
MVRDPSAVRIEVDEGKGPQLLLAPGAQEDHADVPDTAPPFHEGLRQKTTVERMAAGPIEIQCGDCAPQRRTLVPLEGKIVLGEEFEHEKIDFTQHEMRMHFTDAREAPYHTESTYEGEAVTPWTNVSVVTRVSTPNRAVGERLLLSAAICGALGGLSLVDGVTNHHTTTEAFGAVFLPISTFLLIAGGWYSFAPADEKVLFKAH